MLRGFLFLLAYLISGFALASDVPKFTQYKVAVYNGPRVPVRIESAMDRKFATRLKETERKPINFAGGYVLTTWNCGAGCLNGAVVDASSGKVTFLPDTICCWADGQAPMYFKPDSVLIVFAGNLGGREPAGVSFRVFDGSEFKEVGKTPSAVVAASPASMPTDNTLGIVDLPQLWESAEHKPTGMLLACYAVVTQALIDEAEKRLGPDFERAIVLGNGFKAAAQRAFLQCDPPIARMNLFTDEKAYADARAAIFIAVADMQEQMLSNCKGEDCRAVAELVEKRK